MKILFVPESTEGVAAWETTALESVNEASGKELKQNKEIEIHTTI